MKTFKLILLAVLAITPFSVNATHDFNGQSDRRDIGLNLDPSPRKPRMADVGDPQAYYTVSTATLSIELDPVYYSQYTIIIQSDYASLDYIVTSPVVNIPVGSLDSVVDIYIESDDCGSYYGVLDQSAYGSTF